MTLARPDNTLSRKLFTICRFLAFVGLVDAAIAAPTLQLTSSLTSPQPLGTTLALTATAVDSDPGTISYRFEVGSFLTGQLRILRDYSVANTFNFTPTVHEGYYSYQVTARNNSTLNTASQTIAAFQFTSLVAASTAVVVPTAHPLVALFAAPACTAGDYMRVSFVRAGGKVPSYTNFRACAPPLTMNFLVAGMNPASIYTMHSEIWNGSAITAGANLSFTTGTPSVTFPSVSVPVFATQQDSLTERLLLISDLTAGAFPMAVDLLGVPVWYYLDPNSSASTPNIGRPVEGGTILLIASGANSVGSTVTTQHVLREIDLAGNTVRETNTSRVAEQLIGKYGLRSLCVTGSTQCLVGAFHHEALRLTNGHTLVLADEERIYTDGTQGSSVSNPVDVIGDLILDLDSNFQVSWYWDSFSHLDVNRTAILGETCTLNAGGCPSVFLANVANDWLHSNAINYIPSSGDLLLSMRHQDWIIKIDYQNGLGSGDILWTLGSGGSFAINSTDPYPWFSHQHDPGYELGGTSILSMFDNGNTRVAMNPNLTEHSRGYVLNVNETTMTVTPILLEDMGVYSAALGSAQRLSNGDYHFLAGFLNPGPYNQSVEVLPSGAVGFTLQQTGTIAYRSFRMSNLYKPPVK